MFLPVYNSAKIIKKYIKIFQSYDHKCSATFMVHGVVTLFCLWSKSVGTIIEKENEAPLGAET